MCRSAATAPNLPQARSGLVLRTGAPSHTCSCVFPSSSVHPGVRLGDMQRLVLEPGLSLGNSGTQKYSHYIEGDGRPASWPALSQRDVCHSLVPTGARPPWLNSGGSHNTYMPLPAHRTWMVMPNSFERSASC